MSTPTVSDERSTPDGLCLPAGTRLVLDHSVRRLAGGRVLLGGSPLRLLRLGAPGVGLLDRWAQGEPVGTGGAEQRLARRLCAAGLAHPAPPAGAFTPDDVTLVTPVRDTPKGIRRLLAATRELAARIVVDDGSTPPVSGATVRHENPAGPAAARNAGWQLAGTDLVAFLDADTFPEPGWLEAVLAQFADPAVMAVAPRIRSLPGESAVARYDADRSSLDLGERPAAVRPMSRVSYVPSAALVVRRSALEAVGGFDTRLRFGEDVDLVWRLVEGGHIVRYTPDSHVWHEPRASSLGWLRQRFNYGTSAAALSTRHPGMLSPARMSPWSAAAWALLASGHPVLAVTVAAVTAGLLPRKLRHTGMPTLEALRLAGLGHFGAGRILAEATRRAWWPLALVAAVVSRRARLVALATLLPCLSEATGKERSWFFLRVLDDLAYGAGVWTGCVRVRTTAPLRPQFTDGDPR